MFVVGAVLWSSTSNASSFYPTMKCRKLRTSIHGQVLINLSLSLMGLYIFFLTGAHLTYIPVLCGISSALLHYFMLVFFGWTTAEAVLLYVKLVIIIGTQKIESRFILKAALGTWRRFSCAWNSSFYCNLTSLHVYTHSGAPLDSCCICWSWSRLLCQPLLVSCNSQVSE